jgi:uncharacterized protein YcfJ
MLKKTLIALLAAATLAGCATDDPNQGRNIGIATGAIIGGVIGKQVSEIGRASCRERVS